MCGRFNVESDPLSRLLLDLVRLRHPGPDNHNAAPTESIVVLRLGQGGAPELVPMRWWLTPYWAKEVGTRYAMFNARSETLASSRAFREPFRRRRCVVPVSGFYEWCRRTEGGAAGGKIPYYIRPQAADGLLLAGIWDRWRDAASDTVLESFAIVTTAAADAMAFVHNRQPVMLSLEDARGWLDGGTSVEALVALFAPALPMRLDAVPVSTHVNNSRNKDPRCTQAIADPVPLADDPADGTWRART